MWKLDGTYLTDIGTGFMAGAKSVGNYLFVATDAGTLSAVDLTTFQTEVFTDNTLFGKDVDFKPGSVFATTDGHLGLIARDKQTGFLTVKTFEVPQNTAPVVSAWDGTAAFVENAQPVVLDANALVSDGNSSDFAGDSVTVSVVSHGEAADRLSVRHGGNSVGQIGVSGNGISYGGVLIGTMTGGSNGSTPLVVTLNSAANAQSVTALLRAVTFQNVSDSPSTQTRQVQVTVAFGDGGASASVSKRVNVLRLAPTVWLSGQTVQWTNTGSSSYRVFVQGSNGVVLNESVTGTSRTLSLSPGAYSIWVRGDNTAWSAVLQVTVYHPAVTVTSLSTLDPTPTVQWSGETGATYDVWVAPEGQTTASHRRTVSGTSTTLPWMARGRYTIWVRLLNTDGTRGFWSTPASLNVGDRPVTSVVGSELRWAAFQGAASYELWVELAGTSGRIAVNPSSVTGASVNLSSLGLAAGSYRIWIRAISNGSAGSLGSSLWSVGRSFSV